MSTQNILNNNNLSTSSALVQFFTKASLDNLKKVRFDVGCCTLSHNKMREMLRLYRLVCEDSCHLSEEDKKLIRDQIIKNSILKLDEL
jgi:uncharacterized hydantoinase/oxoprolinase family protein